MKDIFKKITILTAAASFTGVILCNTLIHSNLKSDMKAGKADNKKYVDMIKLSNKESDKNTDSYLQFIKTASNENNSLSGENLNKIDSKTIRDISNCVLKYYPSVKLINHLAISVQKQPDANSKSNIEKNYYTVSVGENSTEKLTQYAVLYVSKNLDKVAPAKENMNNSNYLQKMSVSSNGLMSNFIYAAAQNPNVKRIYGAKRIETAANIAQQIYSDKVSNVVIATGNDFPDGLSGSTLAQQLNAPILLTGENSTDSTATIDYVKNHLDTNGTIYLLGGTGAVSDTFKNTFVSMGYKNIVRLGGSTRFDTCDAIVNRLNIKVGTPVILVTGNDFPDALSFSGVAAEKGYPIILVNGNSISDSLASFIQKVKPATIYVAGGDKVVGSDAVNRVKTLAGISDNNNIVRFAGSDRYATSMAIANYFYKDNNIVTFATGNDFPDALAGSILAANNNAPIILVQNDMTQPIIYITKQTSVKSAVIFGGTGAVSQNFGDKTQTLLSGRSNLSADRQLFINNIVSGAEVTYKEYGVLPSITLAQASLESGFGTTDLAIKAHNLFGIKADSRWTGKTISYITDEYENGQWITITDTFRAYDNFSDSIEDHGRFLYVNSRYKNNGLFAATDYNGQADALQRAGYATDPNYANKLKEIVSEYGFDAYDHIN